MLTRHPAAATQLLDVLYRYRWWTTAVAVTLLVFVVPDRDPLHPVAWVVYALLLVMVWVPTVARWTRPLVEARPTGSRRA